MKYLLDTCVLSECREEPVNIGLKNWLSRIPEDALFISALSIGEIRNGIERLEDSRRKENLELWLEYKLMAWFEGRILPLDRDTLNCWGYLCAHNRSLPAIDSLLAATAIHHRLILVTRNVKDFLDISELQILNPWE